MKSILAILAAFFVFTLAHAEQAPTVVSRSYPARVVSVHDGDTVRLEVDCGFETSRAVSVRLRGVFAPEVGKPGADKATAKLRELLPAGALVVFRPDMTAGHETMTFTRYVGKIWGNGTDVCEAMNAFLGGKFGTGAR